MEHPLAQRPAYKLWTYFYIKLQKMDSCLLCLQVPNETKDGIIVNSLEWQELEIQNIIEKHFWSMASKKHFSIKESIKMIQIILGNNGNLNMALPYMLGTITRFP